MGKPSVESPVDRNDPVPVPIDVDDDTAVEGQRDEQDEEGGDLNNKVILLESQISHLKRAPIQTSCLVTQLEKDLSAALVKRRESWPLWRQARRHQ